MISGGKPKPIDVIVVLCSLIPRPLITANAVEGLVKLQHRMTSSGHLEVWLITPCMHTLALQFTGSATPPNVFLTSFYIGVLPGLPPC